jgi:hypothetical protein
MYLWDTSNTVRDSSVNPHPSVTETIKVISLQCRVPTPHFNHSRTQKMSVKGEEGQVKGEGERVKTEGTENRNKE